MVWFPLLRLEEVVAFACCAVAAIVTAGRLAATAMLALAVKNLRRDVASSVEVVSSFTGSSSACGQIATARSLCHHADLLEESEIVLKMPIVGDAAAPDTQDVRRDEVDRLAIALVTHEAPGEMA